MNRGIIPDLHCDTQSFIKMKKIYEEKAKIDRETLLEIISELSLEAANAISNEELINFTKNYLSLTSVSYRTLEEEFEKIN